MNQLSAFEDNLDAFRGHREHSLFHDVRDHHDDEWAAALRGEEIAIKEADSSTLASLGRPVRKLNLHIQAEDWYMEQRTKAFKTFMEVLERQKGPVEKDLQLDNAIGQRYIITSYRKLNRHFHNAVPSGYVVNCVIPGDPPNIRMFLKFNSSGDHLKHPIFSTNAELTLCYPSLEAFHANRNLIEQSLGTKYSIRTVPVYELRDLCLRKDPNNTPDLNDSIVVVRLKLNTNS